MSELLLAAKDIAFINTPEGISNLVDWVTLQGAWIGNPRPSFYIDLEGENLSRNGKISLLTMLISPWHGLGYLYIIDIHTLGSVAFSTVGSQGKSLKDVLESPEILKVFFDVRNDSDALYAHYGVKLQGIRDVQLMESATRSTTNSRKFVRGLAKCIEEVLQGQEKEQWRLCKDNGERLWCPEKGGSYNVFNIRPLSDEIVAYCVGDVKCLPALYQKFNDGTDRWRDLVAHESQNRVFVSQQAEYLPDGAGRALSPWSPEQNKMLDSWHRQRVGSFEYRAR